MAVPVTHHVLTPGTADTSGHIFSWITHHSVNAQKVPSDTTDSAKVRTVYWGAGQYYSARKTYFRFGFKPILGSPARLLNFHSSPHDPAAHAPDYWAAYRTNGTATGVSPLAIDWKRGSTYGPGTPSGGYGPVVNGMIFVAEPQSDRLRQYHFPILTDAQMDARMNQWTVIEGEIGWGRSDIGIPGYLKAKLWGDTTWRVDVTDVNTHWVGQQMAILWEGGGYWNSGLQSTVEDENAACQLGRTRVEMLADAPVVHGGWGTGTRTSGTPFTYPTDAAPPTPPPSPPGAAATVVTGTTTSSVSISSVMPSDQDVAQYEIRYLTGTTFPAANRLNGTVAQAPTNTTPAATVTKTITGLASGTTISGLVFVKDAAGSWNSGYGSSFQATTGVPAATTVASSLIESSSIEKGGTWTVTASPTPDLLELWADGVKLTATTTATASTIINLLPGTHQLGIVITVAGVRTSLGTGGIYATVTVTASQQSLPLTVYSQDATSITLRWASPTDCVGYKFYKNDVFLSSTWNGAQNSMKFTKPGIFKVEALLKGPFGSH